MSIETYFNLTNDQNLRLITVVLALKKALDAGVGVAALTFAIEDSNCGLIDLMSRVAQEMYKENGLLTKRCAEFGAAQNAEALGKTLEDYVDGLQQFAQKEYRV